MAKLTAHLKVPGANAGAEVLSRLVELDSIKTDPEFASLFLLQESTLQQIVERMKKYGFDKSQPLIIVKYGTEEVLGDGHTRRKAAQIAGIKHVPVVVHAFDSKADAMEFVLGLQTARRNLSDAELATAILKLDQLKNRGRRPENSTSESQGKSAAELAKKLHVSTTKVEKLRAVEKKATDDVKQAVRDGNLSINAAYETTRKKTADGCPSIPAEKEVLPEFEVLSGGQADTAPSLERICLILCAGKMFPAVKLLFKELSLDAGTQRQIIGGLPEKYQTILSKLFQGNI